MSLALLFGASTALEAFSKIEQARIEANSAKRKSLTLDQQADEVLRRAEINIETVRQQGEKLEGAQVSALAKGGVDVSSGSALQILEEGALNIRKEQSKIRRESEFEAAQLRGAARQLRRQSRRTRRLGGLAAGTTLLSGAATGKSEGIF